VACQDLQRLENQLERLGCGTRIINREEFNQALEVIVRALRKGYVRHCFARGLRAGLPAARAV